MSDFNRKEVPAWQQRLNECLPLFGHRNWIVVADAAYPEHAGQAIETILTGADQIGTLRTVLREIGSCRHVRAKVYTDFELEFVAESDAPGVFEYQRKLDDLFAGLSRERILHEQIIAKLDQSAQLFRILILKTDMTIPYTSVFLDLDCRYWNADAEARLQRSIEVSKSRG